MDFKMRKLILFFCLSYFFLCTSPAHALELPLAFTQASTPQNMGLGQTQLLNFTIKNNVPVKTLPLKNISIVNDGDNQPTSVTTIGNNTCGSSLPSQASCSFSVTIKNVIAGTLARHVSIDYDGRIPLASPLDISIQQAEYTVLVYMVGSDLETDHDYGTINIQQMMQVGSTANMNVVIETGGALKPGWTTVQRKLVQQNNVMLIKDLGSVNMADTSTISDFLEWGIENFPANKYIAIFWDHGGGPNGGFGADQNFANASTPINQLSSAALTAVAAVNHNFEIIGFDACLMGNLETASGLYPYTNYFVASEDLEPGAGWQYNTFLEYINQNPQANGLQIGTVIANGYTQQNEGDDTTLSVIDSAEIPNLLTAIGNFSTALIPHTSSTADWKNIAQARFASPDYATSSWGSSTDVVDLYNLATNMPGKFPSDTALQEASNNLLDATLNAVKYVQNSDDRKDSFGVTVYFPSILKQYKANYPNITTLNGVLFYSQPYINLINSYMNFYNANTAGLVATPGSLAFDGTNYTAVVSNAYNQIFAAVGNDSCTLPIKKSAKKHLQVVPCYTSLQTQNIVATPGSGTTWNISYNKTANASNWPLANGTPVLLIPDDNNPQTSGENTFYIPVVKATTDGYLVISLIGNVYSVVGFQGEDSGTTEGKLIEVNDGDQFTLRTYGESSGVWSLMPTTTTITAPINISFGPVPSGSFNAFRFIVEDLTGDLNITSTSQSY